MFEEEIVEERPLVGRGRRPYRLRPSLRGRDVRYRAVESREDEDYPIRRGPGLWGLLGIVFVLVGLMLMASAYFGFGAEPINPYADSGAPGVDTPDVVGYGGAEFAARRTMAFMAGGFLAMTGILTTAAARIAAGLLYDD